jgi:hypothetical protein
MFAAQPRGLWLVVIIYGRTVRFLILSRDGSRFALGSFPDCATAFPLMSEAFYFNLRRHCESFLCYVDALSRLDPEPPSRSFIDVFACFHNFLGDLQSPVQSPDFDPKALSALTELWVKNSMSCDF